MVENEPEKKKAFEIKDIKSQVNKALKKKGGGLEEARKIYEETLFEWSDECSRILEETPALSLEERKRFEDAIVNLWIGYANLEKQLRQWKQAVKVYESATTDVIGEKSSRLWIDYGKYCRERGKFANAQKVYLRAIEVLAPQERDSIWNEFLEAVKEKGTAGVETVAQLKTMLGIEEKEKLTSAKEAEASTEAPVLQEADDREIAEEISGGGGGGGSIPSTALSATRQDADMDVEEDDDKQKSESGLPKPADTMISEPSPQLVGGHPPPSNGRTAMMPEPAAPAAQVVLPSPSPAQSLLPPSLLFPTVQLTMEDAYGAGLDADTTSKVREVLTDSTLFDIVEGKRLVQLMKEELAEKIVNQLEARHADLRQRLHQRHAEMQAAASAGPLPPMIQNQHIAERASLEATCQQEKEELKRQLILELWQLLESEQSLLGEEGIGLPLVRVSRDVKEVEMQQRVLRTVTANLQLYHFHQKQQHLQQELLSVQEQETPTPSNSSTTEDQPSSSLLSPSSSSLSSTAKQKTAGSRSSSSRGGGKGGNSRSRDPRATSSTSSSKKRGGSTAGRGGKGRESAGRGGGENRDLIRKMMQILEKDK